MVLHKMSAQHRERKSDRRLYCIANYLTNCFTMRDMTNSQRKLTAIWGGDWDADAEENRTD